MCITTQCSKHTRLNATWEVLAAAWGTYLGPDANVGMVFISRIHGFTHSYTSGNVSLNTSYLLLCSQMLCANTGLLSCLYVGHLQDAWVLPTKWARRAGWTLWMKRHGPRINFTNICNDILALMFMIKNPNDKLPCSPVGV